MPETAAAKASASSADARTSKLLEPCLLFSHNVYYVKYCRHHGTLAAWLRTLLCIAPKGDPTARSHSQTLTPIFLLVSAFLINLTPGRIVALEREQIGLFKVLRLYSERLLQIL